MRLPRMRREWARPRRPRGHSALLMVAHQGPPIAMYPPHTSASASTPAHAGASSLRASAASCFCSAASSRSCRRSRQPLLRLRLLWRLLTAPPARAGVPAVPDLRRQGHEVQPKRPDARRDRLQEAPQPVRESARYGPETQGAASTMLCQVAERSARACAPRARRLWAALAALGSSALAGAAPSRLTLAASRVADPTRRRSAYYSILPQEPGGRILRRRQRPLRRRARPVLSAGGPVALAPTHGVGRARRAPRRVWPVLHGETADRL